MRIVVALKSIAFIAFVSVGFAFGTAGGIVTLIVSYAVARICESKMYKER